MNYSFTKAWDYYFAQNPNVLAIGKSQTGTTCTASDHQRSSPITDTEPHALREERGNLKEAEAEAYANYQETARQRDALRAENERLRELSERNEVAAAQMSTLIRNCMVLLCGNDYERTSTFTQFEVTIETLTRYYGPNLQRKMIRREAVRAALVQLRAEMQTVDDLGLRSEAVIVDLFKTFDATMAQLGLGVEGK